MAGESSPVTYLSVTMTTDDGELTATTGETAVTSSSPRRVPLYFDIVVIIIGIVGIVANGLVLYAMVASKQHKKNELIFNQNVLDFYSCLLLVIKQGMHLFNIDLTGSRGYWLCMLIFSESLLWCGVYGSFVNLTFIAVERYLKVVHPALSKKLLRKKVIYAAIAFVWIASYVHLMPTAFKGSAVINGDCIGYAVWENPVDGIAYSIFYFLAAYVIVLAICVFCYGKILISVRRQAKVMAGHSGTESTAAQTQSTKVQANLIKTMILVCAFYAITWLPESTYYLLMGLRLPLTFLDGGYYTVLFIGFIYICAN